MNRQLKWQQERRASDKCRICGEPTTAYVTKSGVSKQYAHCSVHRAYHKSRYESSKKHKLQQKETK